LLSRNGVSIFKGVKVTRLAEGVLKTGELRSFAIDRTVLAIKEFIDYAKECGALSVYIFATAGVRQAKNGKNFIDKVKEVCGITVDVISGETEAKIGAIGALNGADGGLIDIGGASTEITIIKDGKAVYSKSVNVGAVRLCEYYDGNFEKVNCYLDKILEEFSTLPKTNFTAIGGTATSLVSILLKLSPYNPEIVDGFRLEKSNVYEIMEMLFSLSVEQRKKLVGLQPERAEIMPFGALILYKIMLKFDIDFITVSEKDNLEGYLKMITEKL
jgi:exopolyphosphatase/guanosine-5'-triphosphate,3'-diphosphate pyrophosphatase